jgi:anti-sigma regulatory factor (Ser/Thr protein kinase)
VPDLSWDISSYHGHPLITVDGHLDRSSGAGLGSAVVACLADHPHGLLLRPSGMTLIDPSALDIFADLVDPPSPDVDPGGRVLICGAPLDTVAALRAIGLGYLTLYAGAEQGREELDHRRATSTAVQEDLLPVTSCGRHARDFVTGACVQWGLPDLIVPASLVANELTVNVAVHAHTMMTLRVALQADHLYVGVRDGSTAQPVLSPGDPGTQIGGWGLHLVSSVAASWGVRQNADGKTVWALLARKRT